MVLTREFSENNAKQRQWLAFLRKGHIDAGTLAETVELLHTLLWPASQVTVNTNDANAKWQASRALVRRPNGDRSRCQDQGDAQRLEFGRQRALALRVGPGVAGLDLQVFAFHPTELAQGYTQRVEAGAVYGRQFRRGRQVADLEHLVGSLRVQVRRGEQPGCQGCDENSAPHWITSSARSNTLCGIVNPSVLAVFRFTTKSNSLGRSTGRSPGLAPWRMRSTCAAMRWYRP